ncbi:Lipopolysaccharide-binding protein [Toxocara canis]|uniref:Lipopolysaccharide-binding protein n=1 Tax=Toxocara canis TaxID=6265 RepID=A0A0B2VHY0_TOXCA|nr:Lipopolysaccharide-binding protein [Toxocara canis]
MEQSRKILDQLATNALFSSETLLFENVLYVRSQNIMPAKLTGRFLGLIGLASIQGAVTGDIRQMGVAVQIEFKTAPDGLMRVRVVDCSTTLLYSQFFIDAEGPFSGFVKTFEVQINDIIRRRIPSIFCSSLQKFIEDASPTLFKRLARADLSDPFKTLGPVDNPIVERLVRRFTKGLIIDNRNIADPTINYDFFETQQRGEIRYEDGIQNAPFFPPPMRTTNDSDRMLYLFGSEYLFNSLLFHAYEGNRLLLEIDETSLPAQYKGLVRTSCANETGGDFIASLCFGKLIPEIAKQFPNTTSSFVLLPHELPEFQLANGVGTIDLKTRVLTYIKEGLRRRQILVSSADTLAAVRILIEDRKFAADFKLHKLAVRLHRSAVGGVGSEDISQLAPLSKTFLGPQLSKALRKGVPFPLQESLEFIDPQLTVHDGFVELATDFRLGEKKLREEVKRAFASNFFRLSSP